MLTQYSREVRITHGAMVVYTLNVLDKSGVVGPPGLQSNALLALAVLESGPVALIASKHQPRTRREFLRFTLASWRTSFMSPNDLRFGLRRLFSSLFLVLHSPPFSCLSKSLDLLPCPSLLSLIISAFPHHFQTSSSDGLPSIESALTMTASSVTSSAASRSKHGPNSFPLKGNRVPRHPADQTGAL